jgi:hypothetical protein
MPKKIGQKTHTQSSITALEASFLGMDAGHNLKGGFLDVQYGPLDPFSGILLFLLSIMGYFYYQVLTVIDIFTIIYSR